MGITVGTNIKRLRTAKGITQEQLSVAMNVSCAAVSKWERGETYPDITLLQPLAYYFGVTLDELMGYNQEKIQAEIDEIIALYRKHRNDGKGREIIVKAYHDHPGDYRIMHYYMWDVAGNLADNDPAVLIAHKDEFLVICKKIIEGCTEENLRLGAWNMRAKILHAEGKTDEALEIYKTKFTDWYNTGAQKAEQLFAKNTGEYYFLVQKNMYQLAAFAADKLGKTVFFDPALSMEEKTACALRYGDLMLNAFEETKDVFFLVIAMQFLGRMENDLCYRGGTAEDITVVMDKHLYAAKKLEQAGKNNKALYQALGSYPADARESIFDFTLKERSDAIGGQTRGIVEERCLYCGFREIQIMVFIPSIDEAPVRIRRGVRKGKKNLVLCRRPGNPPSLHRTGSSGYAW